MFSAWFSVKAQDNIKIAGTQHAKHVILIGSDGFGAYAFKKAKVPNLRKMMKNGSYTLKARAVLPSSSAVNWASMIMGSPPEFHGYTEWGSKTPEIPSRVIGKGGIYPTVFSLINEQKPKEKKGAIYTWEGIGYLFEKDMVDIDFDSRFDAEGIDKALDFIIKEKPIFTFIHLGEPDGIGHNIGHDTPRYYKAVEEIDAQVGRLVDTLKKENILDDCIIIFSSDHGGIDKGHGGKTLLELEIPWIVYGKNIVSQGEIGSPVITYDTGATIAWLLGLERPESWRGIPIMEILDTKQKGE